MGRRSRTPRAAASPAPAQPGASLPAEPKPRKWLLALSLMLLGAWIAFLLYMALTLGRGR